MDVNCVQSVRRAPRPLRSLVYGNRTSIVLRRIAVRWAGAPTGLVNLAHLHQNGWGRLNFDRASANRGALGQRPHRARKPRPPPPKLLGEVELRSCVDKIPGGSGLLRQQPPLRGRPHPRPLSRKLRGRGEMAARDPLSGAPPEVLPLSARNERGGGRGEGHPQAQFDACRRTSRCRRREERAKRRSGERARPSRSDGRFRLPPKLSSAPLPHAPSRPTPPPRLPRPRSPRLPRVPAAPAR
jgi:hypothetical protein